MRYPWIFVSIVGLWVAIGLITYNAPERTDATTLYLFGVIFSTLVALVGFRSDS